MSGPIDDTIMSAKTRLSVLMVIGAGVSMTGPARVARRSLPLVTRHTLFT